jgi:diguanylate cyclase (GGDEF)-like protein/PAS domain S-box-containing protein
VKDAPRIALVCDAQGNVLEVLGREPSAGLQYCLGRLWTCLVDGASMTKALNFMQALQADKAAHQWQISALVEDETRELYFTGGIVGERILIVASESGQSAETLYLDELMRVINEQSAALRAAGMVEQKLRDLRERDNHLFEELARLNNDLTALQRELGHKNLELEIKQMLINQILQTSPVILYLYDLLQRRTSFMNQNVADVMGFTPEPVRGGGLNLLNLEIYPDDVETVVLHLRRLQETQNGEIVEFEFRVQDTWGSWHWLNCRSTVFTRGEDGAPTQLIGSAQDVTERKEILDKLYVMSAHDMLTGLYNRAYFEIEVKRQEKGRNYPISLLVFDMDDLKRTNDSLGHEAGDRLLRRMAAFLKRVFRAEDIVARYGGDEFCVLLPATTADDVERILDRLRRDLVVYNQEEPEMQLRFSVGLATVEKGEPVLDAIRRADMAMYAEKFERKKNRA